MSASDSAAAASLAGEPDQLAVRLDGLDQAVSAGQGRLDDELLAPANEIIDRAGERLRLSGEHTIVALAGATGAGKSSLFNALTGLDLAGVGVRRPTTSWALACAWGPDGASGLLEWMGIPLRHQVSRMSMLDRSSDDTKLDGLVLLDLPDHDSTEISHHLEMDRLVRHADLLVWILDPQKYADAAIHDRYIKPMAAHADVTLVVLNQIDRVPYSQRQVALNDVRRILGSEGLGEVVVLGVSATRGDGVDDLKRELAQRIRAKKAAKQRLAADIDIAAHDIAEHAGIAAVPGISPLDRNEFDNALLTSAGVPQLVDAITASTKRRAMLATGWPIARWFGRLRKDRLAGLELGEELSSSALARSAVPGAAPIQRANAELAVGDLVAKASVGLGKPWAAAVRSTQLSATAELGDALDQAVAGTGLDVARPAGWWRTVQLIQWLLFVAALGGLGWLLALLVADKTEFDLAPARQIAGLSLPAWLLIGGIGLGIALAILSRWAAGRMARVMAKRAEVALRQAIGEVATRQVIDPIEAELAAYARYRDGLLKAISAA